ncbi:MAG: DUF4838 domain-containing protein [Lentisphaeria bacterium]|nr:DUF4838 domain-containing protein [Lentisphaeria bacterium]
MKKILLFLLCACTFALLQGEGVPEKVRRPARRIAVNAKSTLTVTPENTCVVIAKNAPSTVKFALKELNFFMEKIFGKPLPVANAPVPGKNAIILGLNEFSAAAGIKPGDFCTDAFRLLRRKNLIYIAGLDSPKANAFYAIAKGGAATQKYDRGTEMGVYSFLERFAGVRMYFPGELGTVIPGAKALILPEFDIFDRPDFTTRRVSTWWDGLWYEHPGDKAAVLAARNLNHHRLRWATANRMACHGLNHFKYIDRFGKSHPEYFALGTNGRRSNVKERFGGLPCYNSGLVEEIYQDIRSYLKGEPASVRKIPRWNGAPGYGWGPNTGPGYVDVMPQDSYSGCYCPKCAPLTRTKNEHPNYATDLVWGRVIGWANRLTEEKIPGTLLMMSYRPYADLPKADIPANVEVMVARSGPWSLRNSVQLKKDNDGIKAWANKVGHKVYLWNYVTTRFGMGMDGVPQMSPRSFAAYYKSLAPWICGAFAESESERFIYNYLNYYVFAKVGWDLRTDVEQLLAEHHRLMFGKAAPFMAAFYDGMEKIWTERFIGRVVDTPKGPVISMPSDYEAWEQIYTAEVLRKFEELFAKARKAVAPGSLERKRIDFIDREFLQNLKQARESYIARHGAIQGLVFYARSGGELFLTPLRDRNYKGLPLVKTGIRFVKGEKELKITFRCEEPRMGDLLAVKRRFDDLEIWRDNCVELFLNPSCDRKTFYQIIVNSDGCIADQAIVSLGKKGSGNRKWNSGAKVAVTKGPGEWTAEITIPLSSLPGLKERMVANLCRSRTLKGAQDYNRYYCFGPFVKGYHNVENFGTISFEEDRNILTNGDFSLPPTRGNYALYKGSKFISGWSGNKNCSLDFDDYISPPCSMKLSGKDPLIPQYLPQIKAGKRYRLSFYMKTKGIKVSRKGGGACANFASGGNNWYPRFKPVGDTPWRFYQVEYTAKQSKGTPYLWMRILLGEGTVWFDDVRMEELP